MFHYISGKGTHAESRTFWSKVKRHTENELMELVGVNCWRPAFIDAEPSASLPTLYAVLRPALRLLRPSLSLCVAGEDLGRAMLGATQENFRRRVMENPEIRELAEWFRRRGDATQPVLMPDQSDIGQMKSSCKSPTAVIRSLPTVMDNPLKIASLLGLSRESQSAS